MGYARECIDSLRLLAKNPSALIPDFVWVAGIFLMNYAFLHASGILGISSFESIMDEFLFADWLRLIASIVVLAFTQFFWGAGVETMRYVMVKDIAGKGRASLKQAFRVQGHYFFKLVAVKALTYCVIVAAFLPSLAVGYLLRGYRGTTAFYALMLVLIVGTAILLRLALLFRFALLFTGMKKPVIAIRKSFRIAVKKPKHTFITWLAITLAFFAVAAVNSLFSSALYLLKTESNLYAIAIAGSVLGLLMERVYKVWESIYIFRNFKT